jgi:hypothetical protein
MTLFVDIGRWLNHLKILCLILLFRNLLFPQFIMNFFNKYHVIFIDDFSRFTWIYSLHAKSEVFEHFVKFKLLVEN